MRRLILPLSLLISAVTAASATAELPDPAFVPGQLIVKFKPGADAAERSRAVSSRGGRVERPLKLARTALVRIDAGADVRQAAAALERDPNVAWAANGYVEGASVPNDAFFSEQWPLHSATDADIDAPEAWDRTTGSLAVKVAVVDSGVNFRSPDLAPNLWRNPGETGSVASATASTTTPTARSTTRAAGTSSRTTTTRPTGTVTAPTWPARWRPAEMTASG